MSIPIPNETQPSTPLQGAATVPMEALIDRVTTPETSNSAAKSSRSLKATVPVEAGRELEKCHCESGVEETKIVQQDTNET